jgi:hypothetical protein
MLHTVTVSIHEHQTVNPRQSNQVVLRVLVFCTLLILHYFFFEATHNLNLITSNVKEKVESVLMYYKNCTKSQNIILEQPQIDAKMLRCSSGDIGFSKNVITITKTLLC